MTGTLAFFAADANPTRETWMSAIDQFARRGGTIEPKPHRTGRGPHPLRAGEYRLQRVIGAGGCGAVYAAEHGECGSPAAVKVIRHELAGHHEHTARFARETWALNLLRHPNIVEVFDVGELDDGRPYFVMEYVDGKTLATLVCEQGRFSATEAVAILQQVAAAVGAAHSAGIVHRDLKPTNIMVVRYEHRFACKLLDFGVAKLLEPTPTERGLSTAGALLGTPVAMAPEHIRGEPVDHRADIYALGVLLFYACTGHYPFEADHEPELFRMHLESPVPRPSSIAPVPAGFDHVVAKAMAKDPDDRYPDVEAFISAMQLALAPTARDQLSPAASGATEGTTLIVTVAADSELFDLDQDDNALEDWMSLYELCDDALRPACTSEPVVSGAALVARLDALAGVDLPDACRTAHQLIDELAESLSRHEWLHPQRVLRIQLDVADDFAPSPAISRGPRGLDAGASARVEIEVSARVDQLLRSAA